MNERDLRALRQVGIELGDDSGGHVDATVLFVEPVGGLDLAHFFARRHVDAEHLLDGALFFRRRFEQVEPDRFLGSGVPGFHGTRASP